MTNQHTPGPWQVGSPKGAGTARFIWRNDEGPNSPAETNTSYLCIARDVHIPADAALISAAPDLLAALREACSLLGGIPSLKTYPRALSAVQAARAAIAKATAGTP